MEIDVKKLYMTSFIGIILLNIIGGGFLILTFMCGWFGFDYKILEVTALAGLVAISLIAVVYTGRMREIMYGDFFREQREKDAKRYMKMLEDERDNE